MVAGFEIDVGSGFQVVVHDRRNAIAEAQGGHRSGRQLPAQPSLIDLLANEVRRALKSG